MNKKLLYILPLALLFACGGGEEKKEEKKEASQEEVCACKATYDKKSELIAEYESQGAMPGEALDKVNETMKADLDKCDEIHSSVGDEKFYEMSKECK